MALLVESIGTAVPEHRIGRERAVEDAIRYAGAVGRDARSLAALYRRSGIENRGSVLLQKRRGAVCLPFYGNGRERGWPRTGERMEAYARHSTELAVRAACRAIERAGVEASTITRLVTVSCTGFAAPGVDIDLIRGLELPASLKRVQVGFMGCHGALNGLEAARALNATSEPGERALLVAIELCSLHAQTGMQADDLVANALFADGAGALLGRVATPADRGWVLADTRSVLVPDTAGAMTWRIGDHGFRMTLAATVPDLLDRSLAPAVDEWLGESGLRREDIRSWAVHPGGRRILDAVEHSLGLGDEALEVSRAVLRDHGNMSSATVLFVVDEIRRRGGEAPCVLLGFGPGLMIEMARLDPVPARGPSGRPPTSLAC